MRIVAVVMEEAILVRKYERARFSPLNMTLLARCLASPNRLLPLRISFVPTSARYTFRRAMSQSSNCFVGAKYCDAGGEEF